MNDSWGFFAFYMLFFLFPKAGWVLSHIPNIYEMNFIHLFKIIINQLKIIHEISASQLVWKIRSTIKRRSSFWKDLQKTLDLINFRHPSTSRFSTINLISFFNILMKFLFEKRVNNYFSHGKS